MIIKILITRGLFIVIFYLLSFWVLLTTVFAWDQGGASITPDTQGTSGSEGIESTVNNNDTSVNSSNQNNSGDEGNNNGPMDNPGGPPAIAGDVYLDVNVDHSFLAPDEGIAGQVIDLIQPVMVRVLSGLGDDWLLGYWGGYQQVAFFNRWATTTGPLADTNWSIYTGVNNSTTARIYQNGVQIISSLAAYGGPNGLSLNGKNGTSEFSNADIAEVIGYSRALAPSETYQVESYLATKWGLTQPPAPDLSSGLISYWNLNQAGDPLIDSKGGHNASSNRSSSVAGKYGNARAFNGQPIQTAPFSFNIGNMTASAWVYPVTLGNGACEDGSYDQSIISSRWVLLGISECDGILNPYANFGAGLIAGSAAIPLNTWSHIAVTRNVATGSLSFYLNGNLVGSAKTVNWPLNNDSRPINIGPIAAPGRIDEPAFWDRILTDYEIQLLATTKLPGQSVTTLAYASPQTIPGLALWLDANIGSSVVRSSGPGSQWNDLSGNSRHFTQGNVPQQPTYVANVLNGKPVVRFSALAQQTLVNPTNFSGPNTFIYLSRLRGSDPTDPVIKTATTDANGAYSIDNFPPGPYQVRHTISPPGKYSRVSPSYGEVLKSITTGRRQSFGLQFMPFSQNLPLEACVGSNPNMHISWNPYTISNPANYRVIYIDNSGGGQQQTGPLSSAATGYDFSPSTIPLTPGEEYSFIIGAFDSAGAVLAYSDWLWSSQKFGTYTVYPDNCSSTTPPPPPQPQLPVITFSITTPRGTFSIGPASVNQKDPVRLNWSITNSPTSVTASTTPPGVVSNWNGPLKNPDNSPKSSGEVAIDTTTATTISFLLNASNSGGSAQQVGIQLNINKILKPYIQTTGGDVHTNESINIAE